MKFLEKLDAETSEPSLSPDGKTLAFSWCKPDYTCAIYTRPFAGGETKLLAGKDDKDGTPYDPKWSPDGRSLAFTRFYSHYNEHLFFCRSRAGPSVISDRSARARLAGARTARS